MEKPATEPRQGSDESVWLKLLNSSAVTAFITVAVGGLLAQWINFEVQDALSRRAVKNALIQEQGKIALIGYERSLEHQQEAVEKALSQIGTIVSASENLISITQPEWNLQRFTGSELERTRSQKAAIRSAYNKTDENWTRERKTLGFLIDFYSQSSLLPSWEVLESGVDGYKDCARRLYMADPHSAQNTEAACFSERAKLDLALQGFGSELRASRQYIWVNGGKVDPLKSPQP
jgi:hypothetical protein